MRFRVVFRLVVTLLVVVACGEEVRPVTVTGTVSAPAEEIEGDHVGDPIPEWNLSFSEIRGTVYRGTVSGMSDERVNGELDYVRHRLGR